MKGHDQENFTALSKATCLRPMLPTALGGVINFSFVFPRCGVNPSLKEGKSPLEPPEREPGNLDLRRAEFGADPGGAPNGDFATWHSPSTIIVEAGMLVLVSPRPPDPDVRLADESAVLARR
mmetsp:Transcript_18353/g.29811  ORF Transcript_18353/g.29811 Transcript_18353/m.29811 type:complete len:122 (-) Transcript_18353:109-474(-)